MDEVAMVGLEINKKIVAIVQFGPATKTSGMRLAEYYQVTIDPEYVSPTGEYIRFGKNDGDELLGWQRVDALTVVEVLAEVPTEGVVEIPKTEGTVCFRCIERT